MNKTANIICSIVIWLMCCLCVRGQEPPGMELQKYQDAAGNRSILFRAQQAARYTFPANGHPYWSGPAFERGDISFEGNIYHDVFLNIDALAQRVLVQMIDGPFAVALPPALASSFTIGGSHFVGIGPGEELPEGFYEVFGTGAHRVYKHVYKRLASSVSNVNGSAIGYYDDNYRTDLTHHFAYYKQYYFRDADGHFTPFKSRGALLRHFPERRREIRRAVQGTDFDGFCESVLNLADR